MFVFDYSLCGHRGWRDVHNRQLRLDRWRQPMWRQLSDYDNWDIIISFIHEVIDGFDIGYDQTHIALVDNS